MLATIPVTSHLDSVKLCSECASHAMRRGRDIHICSRRPDVTLRAARSDCSGALWAKRPAGWEPPAIATEGVAECVVGTVQGVRLIEIGESEALERAQTRLAELETILLVTAEAHERRVSGLIEANNRMRDARREAEAAAERWRTTAESLLSSLLKVRRERDEALAALGEAAREIGDQSMTLDEGTEDCR